MRVFAKTVVVVLVVLAPGLGLAQGVAGEAIAEQSSQRAPVRDEVRTTSGDVYRGLIIEHVSGEYVTIQLPSGAERTINGADVVYAGEIDGSSVGEREPPVGQDAEQADGAVRDVAALPAAEARPGVPSYRLQIRGVEDERLHLQHIVGTGTGVGYGYGSGGPVSVAVDVYEELCSTPCDIRIAEGSLHMMAREEGRRRARRVRDAIDVNDDMAIELEYVSRRALRAALFTTAAAVLISGAALSATSVDRDGNLSMGRLIAGSALSIVGAGLIIPAFVVQSHYRHRIVEE